MLAPAKRRRLLVALALACALSACDDATNTGADHAEPLLLPGAPQGYTLNPGAGGALDLDTARVATIADPGALGAALGRNQYGGGFAHVFQHGADYETDIVLRFRTSQQALAVLDVEHTAMTSGLGVVASPAEGIADSWAYTMFGTTRSGGKNVFCQGVWFAVVADVYGITTCSPNPGDESAALARARLQYVRARTPQSPAA